MQICNVNLVDEFCHRHPRVRQAITAVFEKIAVELLKTLVEDNEMDQGQLCKILP